MPKIFMHMFQTIQSNFFFIRKCISNTYFPILSYNWEVSSSHYFTLRIFHSKDFKADFLNLMLKTSDKLEEYAEISSIL